MAEVSAAWTAWRGSPELIAHVARHAARLVDAAGDAAATVCLTVVVQGDPEVFDAPDDFVEHVTPEALRGFDRVSIAVRGNGVGVDVDLGRTESPSDQRVELRVGWRSPEQEQAAVAVARALAVTLRRGYHRFFGDTTGSSQIGPEYRGTAVPLRGVLFVAAQFLIGALVGAVFVATVDALVEDDATSEDLLTVAVGVVAAVFPFAAAYVVPDVEVAEPGKTRLALVVRWTLRTVAAAVVAQVAKSIWG